MSRIDRGTIKRLHVDKQVIQRNQKYGETNPPITIQTSKGSIKTNRVKVKGPSEFIYSPCTPLHCGARLWIETRSELEYD